MIGSIYVEVKGDRKQFDADMRTLRSEAKKSGTEVANALNAGISSTAATKGISQLSTSLTQLAKTAQIPRDAFRQTATAIASGLSDVAKQTGMTEKEFARLNERMLRNQAMKTAESSLRSIATSAGLSQRELRSLAIQMGYSSAEAGKMAASVTRTRRSTDGFTTSLKSMATALLPLVTFAAVTRGLQNIATGFLETADRVAKLSQSTGIAVETLSALDHAAKLSGTSLEPVARGLNLLSKNALEASQGTGVARQALDMLGIAVVDTTGKLKNSDAIMLEVADRFAGMQDGAAKTALAMQIFGRSGAEMIPLLNRGSDGIRSMTDEANKLGIAFDLKTAQSAERVNDQMLRLRSSFKGISYQLVAEMLPAITDVTDGMLGWVRENDDLIKQNLSSVISGISASMEAAFTTGKALYPVFKGIGETFQSMASGFGSLPPIIRELGFVGAFLLGKPGWAALGITTLMLNNLKEMFEQVKKMAGLTGDGWFAEGLITGQPPPATPPKPPGAPDIKPEMKEIQKLIDEQQKAYARLREELNKIILTEQEHLDLWYAQEFALASAVGGNEDYLRVLKLVYAQRKALIDLPKDEYVDSWQKRPEEMAAAADRANKILEGLSQSARKSVESIQDLNAEFKIMGSDAMGEFGQVAQAFSDLSNVFDENAEKLRLIAELYQEIEINAAAGHLSETEAAAARSALREKELATAENYTMAQLKGYRQLFGTTKQMMKENSKAREALHRLELAFAIAEQAVLLKKAVVAAVVAVATQGSGDPYSAFARVAAMAAIMAGLLSQVGGSFSGGGGGGGYSGGMSPTTGTVLGDPEASSESMQRSQELIEELNDLQYVELTGIHEQMKQLNKNITGLVTGLVRAFGNFGEADFSGLGIGEFDSPITSYLDKYSTNYGLMFDPVKLFSNIFGVDFGLGILDGIIEGVFGKDKTKFYGAGLQIGEITFDELSRGIDAAVAAYTVLVHEKGGFLWGAIGGGVSYSEQQHPVGDDVKQLINKLYEDIREATYSFADAFGVPTEMIEGYVIKMQRLDLTGLSGEEAQKKLTEWLNTLMDNIVNELFGHDAHKMGLENLIGKYQQIDEGLYETAVRLVASVALVKGVIEMAGGSFEATGMAAVEMSQGILEAAGGIEEFTAGANAILDKMLTPLDKLEMQWTSFNTNWDALGFDAKLPKTSSEFLKLLNSIDLTTKEGQKLYGTLVAAAPALADFYKEIEKITGISGQSVGDALWSTITQNQGGAEFIQGLEDNLREGVARAMVDAFAQSLYDAFLSPINAAITQVMTSLITSGVVTGASIQAATTEIMKALNLSISILKDPAILGLVAEIRAAVGTIAPASITAPSRQSYTSAPSQPAVQDRSAEILNKKLALELQIAELMNDQNAVQEITNRQREIELQALRDLNPELATLQAELYGLQDAARDAAEAAAILDERLSLEARYYELTGDGVGAFWVLNQQREIELQNMDASLHSLQRLVWMREDEAAAMEMMSGFLSTTAGQYINAYNSIMEKYTAHAVRLQELGMLYDENGNLTDVAAAGLKAFRHEMAALTKQVRDDTGRVRAVAQGFSGAQYSQEMLLSKYDIADVDQLGEIVNLIANLGITDWFALSIQWGVTIEELLADAEALSQLYWREQEELIREIRNTVTALENFIQSISDTINRIKYSGLNVALPTQKAAEAAEDYNKLKAAAFSEGASLEDRQKFLQFSQTYLQQSQDAYKSSQQYQDIYAGVMDDLERLGDVSSYEAEQTRLLEELVNGKGFRITLNTDGLSASAIEFMMGLTSMVSEHGWDHAYTIDFVTNFDKSSWDFEEYMLMLGFVADTAGWTAKATLIMVTDLAGVGWTFEQHMEALGFILTARGLYSEATLQFITDMNLVNWSDIELLNALMAVASEFGADDPVTLAFLMSIGGSLSAEQIQALLVDIHNIPDYQEIEVKVIAAYTAASGSSFMSWEDMGHLLLKDGYWDSLSGEVQARILGGYKAYSSAGFTGLSWADTKKFLDLSGVPQEFINKLQAEFEASVISSIEWPGGSIDVVIGHAVTIAKFGNVDADVWTHGVATGLLWLHSNGRSAAGWLSIIARNTEALNDSYYIPGPGITTGAAVTIAKFGSYDADVWTNGLAEALLWLHSGGKSTAEWLSIIASNTSGGSSYAAGGIISGPADGYKMPGATFHGTEAIIPLNGEEIPVLVKYPIHAGGMNRSEELAELKKQNAYLQKMSERPMQVTVEVGGEEFDAYIDRRADGVRVKAERRSGGMYARRAA